MGYEKIPRGWVEGEEFDAYGSVVTIGARAGYDGTAPAVIVSRAVPIQAKAYLESLILRVIDVGGREFITFSLRQNGLDVPPYIDIPAEQVAEERIIRINQVINGGTLEIIARNSDAALTPRAVAGWSGRRLLLADPIGRF